MNKKLISLGCVYVELLPNVAHQFGFTKGKVLGLMNGMYNVVSDGGLGPNGLGPYTVYTNQVKEISINTKELKNTLEFLKEINIDDIKDNTSFQDIVSAYILKKINSQPDDISRLKFISELAKNDFSI